MPEGIERSADVLELFRPSGLPFALAILAITWIAVHVIGRGFDRLGERFSDRRLLIQQIASLTRFGLYLLGGMLVAYSVLQPRRDVFLAIGGTAAVSVGFALKDIVASVVAGVIILIDRPFQVGDRVTFEGHYGEIRHIGLRTVRLVTLDDSEVTIPNNRFLTEVVTSGNSGSVEMMVQIDFLIGMDQDLTLAKRIVREALATSRFIHLKRPWTVLVTQVVENDYVAIRLRAKGYVLDVVYEKAFETDVTERVLDAFRGAGVLPPAVLHRSLASETATPAG